MVYSGINKQKHKTARSGKKAVLAKKRKAFVERNLRSTELTLKDFKAGSKLDVSGRGSVVSSKVLSKKKAQKLARAIRIAKARSGNAEVEMDLGEEKEDQSNPVRAALWTLLEQDEAPKPAVGEGTTLGGPAH